MRHPDLDVRKYLNNWFSVHLVGLSFENGYFHNSYLCRQLLSWIKAT